MRPHRVCGELLVGQREAPVRNSSASGITASRQIAKNQQLEIIQPLDELSCLTSMQDSRSVLRRMFDRRNPYVESFF